jgi:hypothetical protein
MQNEDTSLQTSPQLAFREQNRVAVALSGKQVVSIYKKSQQSGIAFDILEEVYRRGYAIDLSEQTAYNRVNSFIAGGAAAEIDKDLTEKEVWDKPNPAKHHKTLSPAAKAKAKARAKSAGRPYSNMIDNMWASSHKEEYTGSEPTSKNMEDPASRFSGTNQLTNTYKEMTPGYSKAQTVKRVVKELNVRDAAGKEHHLNKVAIRMADGSIQMKDPGKSGSSGGGGK